MACEEAHRPGYPLWITFPFDSNESNVQPESVARVVRCAKADDDQAAGWNLAIHFEGAAAYDSRRAGGRTGAARAQNGNGNSVAFPIRVRPPHIPWHEEAMTVELSRDRLKFRTNREYHFGERLLVSFASRSDAPWVGDGEWETEVTGIEMEAGSDSLRITLRKKSN